MRGIPCSVWYDTSKHVHLLGGLGVQFCGWPDGQPLNEQEYCVVEILDVVLMERVEIVGDG